jgi:hypothetical protein
MLKTFSPKKLAISTQNTATVCPNWIIPFFQEKRQFYRKKLEKTAEISFHNIDPGAPRIF